MPTCQGIRFAITAPGDRAGDALHRLEDELGTRVGIGSDGIVSVELFADTHQDAARLVLEAIERGGDEDVFDVAQVRAWAGGQPVR